MLLDLFSILRAKLQKKDDIRKFLCIFFELNKNLTYVCPMFNLCLSYAFLHFNKKNKKKYRKIWSIQKFVVLLRSILKFNRIKNEN